jgi:hypothetical protein
VAQLAILVRLLAETTLNRAEWLLWLDAGALFQEMAQELPVGLWQSSHVVVQGEAQELLHGNPEQGAAVRCCVLFCSARVLVAAHHHQLRACAGYLPCISTGARAVWWFFLRSFSTVGFGFGAGNDDRDWGHRDDELGSSPRHRAALRPPARHRNAPPRRHGEPRAKCQGVVAPPTPPVWVPAVRMSRVCPGLSTDVMAVRMSNWSLEFFVEAMRIAAGNLSEATPEVRGVRRRRDGN